MGGSKKHALSLSQGSFSKAAAIFMRGAYGEYVSTEKWRERRCRIFSTASVSKKEGTFMLAAVSKLSGIRNT